MFLGIWSLVLLLDPGTVNNFGIFWESGIIILAVLLFDTVEYSDVLSSLMNVRLTRRGPPRPANGR